MIRLPRKESEYIKKIENAKADLSNQLGGSPTPDEIAEYLGVTTEQVLELMESSYTTKTASLDFYIDNEGETDLMAVIGQEEKDYGLIEDKDFIQRVMSTLDERERKVITERFYKGAQPKRNIGRNGSFPRCIYHVWNERILERFQAVKKRHVSCMSFCFVEAVRG